MKRNSLSAGHREISATLVGARASARALSGPPDGLPETLDEAYALQDHSIADWGDRLVGWKVGGVPAAYSDRFDDKFLAGPIFAKTVHEVAEGGRVAMPVYDGGFAAIEPEFVFLLGKSAEDDQMFIGAEIASSPIPDINDYGPTAIISDFGNNNGLVIGPEIADWRRRDGSARVTTNINGRRIAEKSLGDFREGPLSALGFLRDLSKRRGRDLPAGTLVSSGAITGVHEAESGAHAVLDFGEFGRFELELISSKSP